jgi:mannose-6-phosphate isomerase-like protein (cupin superfamily)
MMATSLALPHSADEIALQVIRNEDVAWKPFPAFPARARLAVLVGDPAKAGLYVIRVRMPADEWMMPHRHREDRVYTVISGVFYIGVGETLDESRLIAHAPGSVVVLPAGTPHFHWARSGEYITQVSAIGPLGLEYVDPATNPQNQE